MCRAYVGQAIVEAAVVWTSAVLLLGVNVVWDANATRSVTMVPSLDETSSQRFAWAGMWPLGVG